MVLLQTFVLGMGRHLLPQSNRSPRGLPAVLNTPRCEILPPLRGKAKIITALKCNREVLACNFSLRLRGPSAVGFSRSKICRYGYILKSVPMGLTEVNKIAS